MSKSTTITVRFRLDHEEECRAYELLRGRGKVEFGSLNQAVIASVNGFFDAKDHRSEDAFLAKILETVEEGIRTSALGNLAALLQSVAGKLNSAPQSMDAEDEDADWETALDFVDSL